MSQNWHPAPRTVCYFCKCGTQWCFPVRKDTGEASSTLSPLYQTAEERFKQLGWLSVHKRKGSAAKLCNLNWWWDRNHQLLPMLWPHFNFRGAEGSQWNCRTVRHQSWVFLRVMMNTWSRWFILIHWKGMQAEQRSQKRINLPHYEFS